MSLESLYRWERRIAALPMPGPLAWAALIGSFLGFGVLAGRATEGTSPKHGPVVLVAAAARTSSDQGAATPPSAAEATPPSHAEPQGGEAAPSPNSSGESQSGSTPSAGQGGTHADAPASDLEASRKGKAKEKLPAIRHVFLVVLSDQPYATAFGPASEAHYLTGTLEKRGTMLERYYGVAQQGLAGAIGLLSGQGPTEATAADCPTYADLASTGTAPYGQVLGQGCVYPGATATLPGQLTAKHLSWKAYVEGIAEGPGTPGACARPAFGAGDPSSSTEGTVGYQTWRNPLVYFQGIVSSPSCAADDVGMNALEADLASPAKTANFSYLVPGPCVDGDPTPCAAGRPSGMSAADGFLKKVIPRILAAPAYKRDGLLAITVDAAPASGEWADSSSCCGQPRFPNLAAAGTALSPPGGGQVGMLLLSPFIEKGGALVQSTYDHFSLLATVEQLFGLPKLGYAGLSGVNTLSPSLFSVG